MSNQQFATPQEALAHYGKKGMHWGVRNEEKPAGPSRKEQKQEKRDGRATDLRTRAAKADIRVKELQTELAETPKGLRTLNKRLNLQSELNNNVAYRNQLNTTADRIAEGKLSPNQKAALVGAVAVAGLFAAGYVQSKQQSGELNSLKLRGQSALKGQSFSFRKNDAFKNARTPDDVLANVVPGINPNYGVAGGQMNCRRCTFAYELRRRGYDVSATASSMGWGQSEAGLINALTPGSKNLSRPNSLSKMVVEGANGIRTHVDGDKRTNPADLFSHADAKDRAGFFDLLSKQPSGARGEAVFNFGGFGHSLSYERFGDKTFIFDTQKGERFDVGDEASYGKFLTKWGINNVKDVQVTRLDNLQLDEKFLSRWSTNSAPGSNEAARASAVSRAANADRVAAKAEAAATAARETARAQIDALIGARTSQTPITTERPANMHITTWNALQREAGLT